MFTLLQAGQPSGMPNLLFFLGMILVMYFLMFRPQAKRAKEQKKFTEGINVGDQIVTTAGIHGKITAVNDNGTINLVFLWS
jgi:preprotein translocase subunit YajC